MDVGEGIGVGIGVDVAADVGVGRAVAVGAGAGVSRVRSPGAGVSHDPSGTWPLREKPSQMLELGLAGSGGVNEEEEPPPPHAVSIDAIATKHAAPKTVQRNTISPHYVVEPQHGRCWLRGAYRTGVI
jgi:hypothetical protein